MTTLSGHELLAGWRASQLSKRGYWQTLDGDLTYNAMLGRMWRSEQRDITPAPELYQHDLGTPWRLPHASYMVVGDVQLCTTDYDFMALPMAVAKEHMRRGERNLIIAGDLINADAFSTYDSDIDNPAFSKEIDAAAQFFDEYLTVFDSVWWFLGNHERRVGKRTRAAIRPELLLKMATRDKRVKISQWGHCVVANERGIPYRITHARNYSVNQLVVADQLAQKYQMHILQHHEHHLSLGWDRYGRYIIANGGGLFNASEMGYAVIDDSKSPAMKPGFTFLRNGTLHLFGEEPFTDWEMWLPSKKAKALALAHTA